MRHLLSKTSKLALYSVAAGAVFAALALFVPNNVLLPIMNAVCIGIVCSVTIVFLPLIQRSIKDKSFDRVSQLMIGMLLMWLSLIGSRGANIYIGITGKADEVAASPVVAFLAYMAIMGGVLHLTAPALVSQSEWQRNRKVLTIGVVSGLVLALVVLLLQSIYNPSY